MHTCQVSRCDQEFPGFVDTLVVKFLSQYCQQSLLKQSLIWKLFHPLSKTYLINFLQKYKKRETLKIKMENIELNVRGSNLVIIFKTYFYKSFHKRNFQLASKQTGSHATHSCVFYEDFKLHLSVLLRFRDSYFQEHLIMAASETIWSYVLGINFKIKMNSIFLWKQLFSPKKMLLRLYVPRN